MLPPAVVEQQAKLGVSAEESKAQRLQRQQARFRDRGGAFVPSKSNPLVDILLARTVSGESPSKAGPKDVAAKRLSPAKARQTTATQKAVTKGSQVVAESSKSKMPASRKRKAKVVEPEADTATKPTPKRRGRPAKGKKKTPDPDSDTEQIPLSKTKTKPKPTPKGKGKQRNAAPSTSDGNPKSKSKPRAKAKSKVTKEVVEVLVSDDDETLVDAPHKPKSNPKRNTQHEDDSGTDDDTPVVRKRALPHVDDSHGSGSNTATRVKIEKVGSTRNSRKKTLENGEEMSQDGKYPKTNAKKPLLLPDDEDDDDIAASPAKKRKVANLTSAKPANDNPPEPASRTTKNVKNGENPKFTGKGKGKGRTRPDQDVVEPMEEDYKQPPERVSKPKKRKKEDNNDDRPRKVVKFSESGLPHSSSQKLKENQSDGGQQSAAKSGVKDEPDNAPRLKLAAKPPSRAKTLKGPPREVLERIKASAARHLRCADSEPDELDCLS